MPRARVGGGRRISVVAPPQSAALRANEALILKWYGSCVDIEEQSGLRRILQDERRSGLSNLQATRSDSLQSALGVRDSSESAALVFTSLPDAT